MDTSLSFLQQANFDLEHNDPMQDVNQALAACASALNDWAQAGEGPRPMSVYPSAVVYDSANQRDQQFALYLGRNPHLSFTQEGWQDEKRAYGIIGDAVVTATQRNSIFYMVSMQNPVFSHSWHLRHWGQDTPELRQAYYTVERDWHEFVIVLNRRSVSWTPRGRHSASNLSQAYIYDPSYAADNGPASSQRRALRSIPLVGTKAHKILREIRTRRNLAIDAVYIGGGGNEQGDCRKMSLQWIRGVVEDMVTTEDWDTQQICWELVNNS
jgi:hypothetical protein